jgi:iron complex outermembrane receptor protein
VLNGFTLAPLTLMLQIAIKQSPYQLLNARLGISSKHADIFLWGRNITDKHYIAYAYDFGAVHLADPRTYGITLMAKF